MTAAFETLQRTAVASTSKISSMTPHCESSWYLFRDIDLLAESFSSPYIYYTARHTHALCLRVCLVVLFFFRQSATKKLKISLQRDMHELHVAPWREIPSACGNIKGAAASFGLEPTHARSHYFALSLPLLCLRIFTYQICEHKYLNVE